ncbi:hypothetical protein ABI59_09410 [Acidobacteria bacterium Mor1]|nr:hypothetical protein ABI59_09410 [Acidobacteria bacterium Mor1]
MQGSVSFHPIDMRFFEELIEPLICGGKVNPEDYLAEALRCRQVHARARRYIYGIDNLMSAAEPPPVVPQKTWLNAVKVRVERMAFDPGPVVKKALDLIDPDLHLEGRPFFISEGSAERVADLVQDYRDAPSGDAADSLALEQLVRLDPELAREVEADPFEPDSSDMSHRNELLGALKNIFDLAKSARDGDDWGRLGGDRRPAVQVMAEELPWKAVAMSARVMPFWQAKDVDGLETICGLAGVEPPPVMVPAWRLFGEACQEFPELQAAMGVELNGPQAVGAFVAAEDVAELQDFLNASGSRIIQAATQHGEGAACRTLLRKIRECVTFCERHGLAYLEASGIESPELQSPPKPGR